MRGRAPAAAAVADAARPVVMVHAHVLWLLRR
jgi:hypothetical protein